MSPHHLLRPAATLAINERVLAMRASGHDIFQLGFGESRFPVHPQLAAALAANAQRQSYLPSQGLPALRQAVAEYYRRRMGLQVEAGQVIIGPGSKLILFAAVTCLDGDLLLPYPSWVSYAPQARLAGKRVFWAPTRAEDDYRLHVSVLAETVERARGAGGNPGILLLNTPNNPTGSMFSAEDLQAITAFAAEEGIAIVSDEIYALLAHAPCTHRSPYLFFPEGTVVTGGLSKHLSLGGWRLGVGIAPAGETGQALMQAMMAVASDTWSAVSAPVQHAALVAYSGDPDIEAYIDHCARLHALRTRYLYNKLTLSGIPMPQPSGGFYLYPSFDAWRRPLRQLGVETSEQLAHHLLAHHQIATLPGVEFGADPRALSLRLATSYVDFEAADGQAGAGLLRAFEEAKGRSDAAWIEAHCPRLVEAGQRLAQAVRTWETL